MRILLGALVFLGLLTLAAPSRAFANTIETFAVSGMFSNIDGDSGVATFDAGSTLTIDTTTGLATGADLSLTYTGGLYGGDTVTFAGLPGSNTTTEYSWTEAKPTGGCPVDTIAYCSLDLQDTNGTGFQGFAGGALTGGYSYTFHIVVPMSGTVPSNIVNQIDLTPVATPEPSSVAMVTCLVGIMGAVVLRKRRRSLQRP